MVWSPSDLDLNSIFYAYLSDVANSMDTLKGFPGSSNHKESTCSRGYLGSTPELGSSPGEGNGYPLQYSCLENPMNRRARWATVHGSQRVGHNLATNTYAHWMLVNR